MGPGRPRAVRNAEAFLVTVTTRLALDRLRSAQSGARATSARGCPSRWSPTHQETRETHAIEAEELNLALLGALERLNPVERAVLVLRDVFDLEYAEIADAVEKTPANVARSPSAPASTPATPRATSRLPRRRSSACSSRS